MIRRGRCGNYGRKRARRSWWSKWARMACFSGTRTGRRSSHSMPRPPATSAFLKHAGIAAEGVHELDMARYRVRYLPPKSAVLCISYSGEVGRTIEAAAQARAFGHRVIALTGHGTSPLAREATDVVTLTMPSLGSTPGTISFLAMLV